MLRSERCGGAVDVDDVLLAEVCEVAAAGVDLFHNAVPWVATSILAKCGTVGFRSLSRQTLLGGS